VSDSVSLCRCRDRIHSRRFRGFPFQLFCRLGSLIGIAAVIFGGRGGGWRGSRSSSLFLLLAAFKLFRGQPLHWIPSEARPGWHAYQKGGQKSPQPDKKCHREGALRVTDEKCDYLHETMGHTFLIVSGRNRKSIRTLTRCTGSRN
jgi:hypothetical protein